MLQRLPGIDALRGFAALAVLLVHIPHGATQSLRWFLATLPLELGFAGVHLFIVLSGFCIHYRVAHGEAPNWRSFWVRRFWRLYPPYLATIALSIALYYAAGHRAVPTWGAITNLSTDLGVHLVMAHNLTDYARRLGNPAFWSLGLEEQLYALYFVLLMIRRRLSTLTTLVLVGTISAAWRAATLRAPSYVDWPFTWWFLWCLGAVAADASAGRVKLPKLASSRLSAALFIGIGFATSQQILLRALASKTLSGFEWLACATSFSHVCFGLGFVCLLNAMLKNNVRLPKMEKVGEFSYSLYLVHEPLIYAFEGSTGMAVTPLLVILRFAILIPVCLVAARLFFFAIERPFINRKRASRRAEALATATLS